MSNNSQHEKSPSVDNSPSPDLIDLDKEIARLQRLQEEREAEHMVRRAEERRRREEKEKRVRDQEMEKAKREAEEKDAEIAAANQEIQALGDQVYRLEEENERLKEESERLREEDAVELERLEALSNALKEVSSRWLPRIYPGLTSA